MHALYSSEINFKVQILIVLIIDLKVLRLDHVNLLII